MRRPFSTRTIIQFGLFMAVVGVVANVFNSPNFAALAYPPIPATHYEYINNAVKHCNVPPSKRGFIAAVAWKESTFHPGAQSGAGAIGVMQVLRGTGLGVANEYQIGGLNANTFTDPNISYKLGTCYLHSVITRLGTNIPEDWNNDKLLRATLIAYNAGPARGKSFLSGNYNGPTSSLGYAERILQAEKVYALDFGRYDQESAVKGTKALEQVRDIIWVLLKKDSEP